MELPTTCISIQPCIEYQQAFSNGPLSHPMLDYQILFHSRIPDLPYTL